MNFEFKERPIEHMKRYIGSSSCNDESMNGFQEYCLTDLDGDIEDTLDFYIDVGARISDGWDFQINDMAARHPATCCIAFEPDPFYYRVIKEYCPNNNIQIHNQAVGYGKDDWTFEDIFTRYGIKDHHRVAIKIDCEGLEYEMVRRESFYIKKSFHIAFECHITKTNPNEFLVKNKDSMFDDFEEVDKFLDENFSDTHIVYRTGYRNPKKHLRTYVIKLKE